MELLLAAFALMLVLEGLLPFISPARWREFFSRAQTLSDGQLRFLGLSCIVLGMLLLAILG